MTEEQLQRLFRESRERHKRKELRRKGLLRNKVRPTEQSDTFKKALELASKIKALQALKNAEVDNVSTQEEKTPQRGWKPPLSRSYGKYRETTHSMFDLLFDISRDELMELECDMNEFGRINWDVWNNIVNETRRMINEGA